MFDLRTGKPFEIPERDQFGRCRFVTEFEKLNRVRNMICVTFRTNIVITFLNILELGFICRRTFAVTNTVRWVRAPMGLCTEPGTQSPEKWLRSRR